MTSTVTIYRLRSGFANVCDRYELDDAHVDEARGDDRADYQLPDGFEVTHSNIGTMEIYDVAGEHCEVTSWSDQEGPVLVSSGQTVALERA